MLRNCTIFSDIIIFFCRALLERDHALRAAHDSQLFQAAHAQHIQQQEEALKRLTRP